MGKRRVVEYPVPPGLFSGNSSVVLPLLKRRRCHFERQGGGRRGGGEAWNNANRMPELDIACDLHRRKAAIWECWGGKGSKGRAGGARDNAVMKSGGRSYSIRIMEGGDCGCGGGKGVTFGFRSGVVRPSGHKQKRRTGNKFSI